MISSHRPKKTRSALVGDGGLDEKQQLELPAKCCNKLKCVARVGEAGFLSMDRIKDLRKFIHGKKTTADRQGAVRDIIQFQTAHRKDADGRTWFSNFFLDQKPVCQKFFCFCYWISKSRLLKALSSGLSGHVLPYRERRDKKREAVMWWLNEERGHHEIMPDQPKIQMPYPSRREAYRHFKLAIEMHNDQCRQDRKEEDIKPLCKYDFFRITWKTYAPDVVLRRYVCFSKFSESCELT
jgi:hypothetical protein